MSREPNLETMRASVPSQSRELQSSQTFCGLPPFTDMTKARLTGKRLQGPGGMYGGPRTTPEPQKEEAENDDE